MKATYIIPECNLSHLISEVERINKRCDHLGLPRIEMVAAVDHFDDEYNMPYHAVTVTGATPMLNGWSFVATLEPIKLEDGTTENIVASIPGHECPAAFRTIIGKCDHCKTVRRRSQTFVMKSEAGEFKCVGRQCIKDFLGYHGDPQAIAKMCEMLGVLSAACRAAEDFDPSSGKSGDYITLETVLACTSQVIRLCGWMSKTVAREKDIQGPMPATAHKVLCLLNAPSSPMGEGERELRRLVKEDTVADATDTTAAALVIEWAKGLTEEQREGDYMNNLSVIARAGYVTRKTLGIACSMLIAHRNDMESRAAQQHPSEWVGAVGVREKGPYKVTCNRLFRSEGMYGVTGIHNMTDDAGNELVWFATSGEWMTEGQKAFVSFTVTKHGEYKGRKQTTVNRLKIWTAEEVAAHEAKAARKKK
jgi:hypothetical protein